MKVAYSHPIKVAFLETIGSVLSVIQQSWVKAISCWFNKRTLIFALLMIDSLIIVISSLSIPFFESCSLALSYFITTFVSFEYLVR